MNANKQDAGGLPELPAPDFMLRWDSMRAAYYVSRPNIRNTDVYTADQMRAIREESFKAGMKFCRDNELCRAAPTGAETGNLVSEQNQQDSAHAGVFAGMKFTEVRIPQGYALDIAQAGVLAIVPQAAPAGGDRCAFESAMKSAGWAYSMFMRSPVPGHDDLYYEPATSSAWTAWRIAKQGKPDSAPAGSGEVLSVYSLNRVIDRVEGEAQWNDWSQGRILTELRNYIRAQATVIPDPQSMGDDEADNIESYATALERMSMCNSRTADGANLSQAARLIHDYAALLRKLQQGADSNGGGNV